MMTQIYEDLSAIVLSERNLESFKTYITGKPALLAQQFPTLKGGPSTVLTWLVEHHSKEVNLLEHIQWLLTQPGVNPNTLSPVHLALSKEKFDLLEVLVAHNELDINAKNEFGETILLLALSSRRDDVIQQVLAKNPDVLLFASACINTDRYYVYPLVWAIFKGLSAPILSLLKKGADITMTLEENAYAPIHYAALHRKVDSLKILLENREKYFFDVDIKTKAIKIKDGKTVPAKTAIHLLCDGIIQERDLNKSLECIAYLMSHGASIPKDPKYKDILIKNSSRLMSLSTAYLKEPKNNSLARDFYKRCHDRNNPLSDVVYNTPTIGKILALESLVPVMKYDTEFHIVPAVGGYTDEERLFALFVEKYHNKFNSTYFHNPLSEMVSRLSKGEYTTWSDVCEYANQNPNSRSSKIKTEIEQLANPVTAHKNLP